MASFPPQPDDLLGVHPELSRQKTELLDATPESVSENLNDPNDKNSKFGIWDGNTIVGRVDLTPGEDVGKYVLGYWLGPQYTGRGYATVACTAIIEHGRTSLGATEIYAGVTKGNEASTAVLIRLGFEPFQDMGDYTRYRRVLSR